VIAAGRELVGARGAFHVGVPAVALEHKVCGAPDFDFRCHAGQKLQLTRLLKEFDQVPLVRELKSKRMVGKFEVVIQPINNFRTLSLT
jgi:hypothetical protein